MSWKKSKSSIYRGLTFDERVKQLALTRPKYIDHKGNQFTSKSAMCRYWDISVPVFNYRLDKGLSIEQCLTGEKYKLNQR